MPDTIPPELRARLADRYELERVIGRGGMATVFAARDVKHGRPVALKVLRPDLAQSIGTTRFLKEIEIAARLTHPHVLPLHDSGDAAGFLYYVMPLVEGESLRGLLNRVGLMDVAGAREIVRRVADALDYAHRQGVLHRDIKPENILLPDGHAVVADFGIAKAVSSAADVALTRTGIAVGTPGYMSPEQAAGLTDLDARTDVYSLAVVAYEMLVGGLPGMWLSEDAQRDGRFSHASPEHRRRLDRLEPGLERALARALAVRPDARFPTPGELASALEHPEEFASRAMAAVAPPPAPLPPEEPEIQVPGAVRGTLDRPARTKGFLGAPTLLVAERVVHGEVPPSEYRVLLEEARAAFGVMGYEVTAGRTLLWSTRRPKEAKNILDWEEWMTWGGDEGPRALLRVSSRQGRTRIRLEQKLTETAGGVFGGIMGGVGGGLGGATVGMIVAFFGAPAEVVVIAAAGVFSMAVGGSYWLSRAIYRSVAASKIMQLESLADRLAVYCEDVAE